VTEFLGIGIVMAMSRYAKTQYESKNLAIVEE
jgi:hypothetical protein